MFIHEVLYLFLIIKNGIMHKWRHTLTVYNKSDVFNSVSRNNNNTLWYQMLRFVTQYNYSP